MGPLNTERQRDYVAGLCEEARGAGAEVLTFGEYTSDAEGNYLLPALVLDPAAHLQIVAEEQFGPALPVIPYDSEAEAVALANDTWSGLCSSVWSADAEHAMKIAGQLRTGVHLLQQPQRHRGRRARAVRRVQRQRHRPRARPGGPARVHRDPRHGRPLRRLGRGPLRARS